MGEMADDHPAAIQRAAIATKDAAIAANTAAIATKDTAIATKDAAIKNCGQAGTSLVDAMVFDISMTAAGTVETVDKAGFETNMRLIRSEHNCLDAAPIHAGRVAPRGCALCFATEVHVL